MLSVKLRVFGGGFGSPFGMKGVDYISRLAVDSSQSTEDTKK
jgi:hypothetical protein